MMSSSSLQSLRARLKNLDTRGQRNRQDDSSHGNTGTLTSEITDHTTWRQRIIESGSKLDDWVTYINYAEQSTHYTDQRSRYQYLYNMYTRALECISLDENKKNVTYGKLHIKFALLQGEEDVEDGRMHFQFARANLRTITLIHVAAAQFELDHGNLTKSRSILRKAKEVEAEPRDLLNKAMQKLLTGEKEIYCLEQHGIKQDSVTGMNLAAKMSEEGLSRRGSWLANNSGSSSSSSCSSSCSSGGSKESPCGELNTVSTLRSSAILTMNEKDGTIPLQLSTTAQKNRTTRKEHLIHVSQSASKSIRGSVYTPDTKPSLNLAATVGPSKASRGAASMFGGAIRLKRTSLPKVRENSGYDDDDNDDDDDDYNLLHGVHPLENDDHITPDNNDPLRLDQTPDQETAGKGRGISYPSTVDQLRSKPLISGHPVNVQSRREPLSSISESPMCVTFQNTPEVPKLLSVMNSESRPAQSQKASTNNDVDMCDVADRSVERCAVPHHQPIPFPQLHSDSKRVRDCENIKPAVPMQQPVFTSQYATPAAVHPVVMPVQMVSAVKKDILVVNGRPYNVLRVIGKGGSSKVYQVFDEHKKKLYAIKDVNLEYADDMIIQGYINEISLLGKLQSSDRIIHLYDHEITDSHMYMVMECGSIDLANFLRKESKNRAMKEEDIKSYWRQMLEAVDCIHKQGIIHSDLKPANFLFVDGKLKLIDFGIANAIQQDHTSVIRESQVGTLNYMSPEAIQDTSSTPHFDDRGLRKPRLKIKCNSDVWSLGCILYYIVYGKTPFQHIINHFAKLQAICDPMHHIQFPETQKKMLIDILKKCLQRNFNKRPSIEELLNHPYLQSQPEPEKLMSHMQQNMFMSRFEQQFKSILSQLTPHSPNSIHYMTQNLMAQMNDGNDVAPVLQIAGSQTVTSNMPPLGQPKDMNGQTPLLQSVQATARQPVSMEGPPSHFSYPQQLTMPPPSVPHPHRTPLGMVNVQEMSEGHSHQKTSAESKYVNSGSENGMLLD